MANILIINGSKEFHSFGGTYNNALTKMATDYLKDKGIDVKVSIPDNDYNLEEEVGKILWADLVIFQMPVWWMGVPWTVKKYIDEVYMHGTGRLYSDDGRTRKDPSKKYGTGGLIQGKKYMLSVTWNAPAIVFNNKDDFFEGKGVDDIYFSFHKAQEFLGMTSLETFMCNDIVKQPNLENDTSRYKKHLDNIVIPFAKELQK